MTTAPDAIREKIQRVNDAYQQTKELLDEGAVPAENRAGARETLAVNSKGIGALRLVLGEIQEARSSFSLAASHYLSSIEEKYGSGDLTVSEGELVTIHDMVYCGILSCDEQTQERAGTVAISIDERFEEEHPEVLHRYYYVKSLGGVVLDDDTVRRYISNLESALDDCPAHLEAYFGALARTMDGIVVRDSDLASEGLDALLRYHQDDIKGTPSNSSELVCLPAAGLFELARRRDLEVETESRFVPDVHRD